MKLALVGGSLAVAVAASASADVKITFTSGDYANGASQILKFDDLEGTLTGVNITFTFANVSGGAWATDAAFVFNGTQYGGYDNGTMVTTTSYLSDWGPGVPNSSVAGTYSDSFIAGGTYNFGTSYTFEWGNSVGFATIANYSNISVILKGVDQVPGPGALALLGVAGLTRGRRRR